MLVEEKPKMECILEENRWKNSILTLELLESRRMKDISIIVLDNYEREPEVSEVLINVFKNRRYVTFSETSIQEQKNLIATIEVKSNPELMEAIKQSKRDKKAGRTRKYDEIARECGFRK